MCTDFYILIFYILEIKPINNSLIDDTHKLGVAFIIIMNRINLHISNNKTIINANILAILNNSTGQSSKSYQVGLRLGLGVGLL